ncbi:MAG: S8 family serine peptidase [Anaerolineae bacterium]|nr:S8 family serine peptidase [Anaerolineae bacterium]
MLAVGGTDDKRTSSWSDDEMWPDSAWNNPRCGDGTYGDREKPEVVASAYGLTLLNNDGSSQPNQQGTSFSAPQVAGLAALLAERNADLIDEPEAMRAIIMASAVHNVHGPSGIPTGQDLEDGAGAIDAALADSIAGVGYEDVYQYPYPACEGPCWWSNYVYNNYPGHPGNFPPGTYRWYYFKATKGERIRVVLAWVSDPAGPGGGYAADLLHTDLDLAIFDPDGQGPVANGYSASHDNSYEIVDFVTEKTGQYAIGVYKNAGTTEYLNSIGLAWVKDATYLPDLRNKGGFVSQVYIRNDGAEPRNVQVHYFDYLGIPPNPSHPSDTCVLNPNQHCWINVFDLQRIPSGSRASAIVDGGEDVSVTVLNVHQASPYTTGSFAGLNETSDSLFVPLLMRYNSNWHSDLTVFNAGSQSASVTVQYVDAAGNVCSYPFSLATNGSKNIDLRTSPGCSLPPPFVGGARVYSTNGQPLAAVANEWRDNPADGVPDSFMAYEAFPAGATSSFQPLLMRDNNTWYTGASFQDTAGSSGSVTTTYFPQDSGVQCGSSGSYGLVANGIAIANPLPPSGQCGSPFVGSGRATRSAGFVSVVNQATTASLKAMSYSAVGQGTQTVVLPLVLKNRNVPWGTGTWSSGLTVQNLGDSQATVRIVYYNADGSLLGWSEQDRQVPARASHVYNPAPTSGGVVTFEGSAVVMADQPIAVVVNLIASGSSDDTAMSYTGVSH